MKRMVPDQENKRVTVVSAIDCDKSYSKFVN